LGLGPQDGRPVTTEHVRNNNAYLLFYERLSKPAGESASPATSIFSNMPDAASDSLVTSTLPSSSKPSEPEPETPLGGEPEAPQGRAGRMDRSDSICAYFDGEGERPGKDRVARGEAALPATVRRAVWKENMTFFKDKHLFDKGYSRFLWNLLKAQAPLEAQAQPSQRPVYRVRALAAGLKFVLQVQYAAVGSFAEPLG
jgi:hypothetical protein